MSSPSRQDPLLILAMDHRASFATLLGFDEATATADQRQQRCRRPKC